MFPFRTLQPVTAISPETIRTRTTFGRSYGSRAGRFFMSHPVASRPKGRGEAVPEVSLPWRFHAPGARFRA